ncbi:C6 transcription factor [Paraphaeosphaeria minitans]|uniref:C6 transcription factor n=1 Tax=Paraphaeosphaeria minitans TaxID=565426 RepID=A0A9P6G776_9PLEO|nr:C6 transcription factor [Paraphaeosphaeria minitans]
MDSQRNPRTRVMKACDRCRGKKSKCNGGHTCKRCRSDNTLCTYSREAKERHPSTSPSYVLALETHLKLSAMGILGLYRLVQSGQSLPGGPLQLDEAGNPLINDILDRLGVLSVAYQHSTFKWDPAVVNRLVYPWEALQPNPLPLPTSAPDNSPHVWPSDNLSNQLIHNPYRGANFLESTTFTTDFDPSLDTALQVASSMDMYVDQGMQQDDWMGLHLG